MAKDRKDLTTRELPGMETRQIDHLRRTHETAIQKARKQAEVRQELQEKYGADKGRQRRRNNARRLAALDAAEQG